MPGLALWHARWKEKKKKWPINEIHRLRRVMLKIPGGWAALKFLILPAGTAGFKISWKIYTNQGRVGYGELIDCDSVQGLDAVER
jgi:hypothetical protein